MSLVYDLLQAVKCETIADDRQLVIVHGALSVLKQSTKLAEAYMDAYLASKGASKMRDGFRSKKKTDEFCRMVDLELHRGRGSDGLGSAHRHPDVPIIAREVKIYITRIEHKVLREPGPVCSSHRQHASDASLCFCSKTGRPT